MRNLQNTIKVACDFVSVGNLEHMAALLPEQRKYRIAVKHGEDVLQLFTLIWYAWISVSTYKPGRNVLARSRGGEFIWSLFADKEE